MSASHVNPNASDACNLGLELRLEPTLQYMGSVGQGLKQSGGNYNDIVHGYSTDRSLNYI